MVNYQNGKIYKITSNQTNQVYIGSTCDALCKRMGNHRAKRQLYLDGKGHKYCSFDILQYDDAVIVLIENHPCDNVEQLTRRERHYIENTPNCINRVVPGRTDAEYRQDNKEVIAIKMKAYHEAHREVLLQQMKTRYDANREAREQKVTCGCGKIVSNASLTRHQKTTKHQQYLLRLQPVAEVQ